jgi:TDG/mug DNA glycosylase family protein
MSAQPPLSAPAPHVLPNILAPGLDIVFCGTAAGTRSAALGHYYAGPGNRFWGLLAETGLTPRLLAPDEDATLPGYGLVLTDTAKGVSGMDHRIPRGAHDPAGLAARLAAMPPRALAFTSLAAARVVLGPQVTLGRQAGWAALPGVTVWALSSPSRANARFTPAPWFALARWRQEGMR